MNAKLIAEQILPTLITYKNAESKMKSIKEIVKSLMGEDEKRREYHSQDVVAKFVKYNKYQVDKEGLQDLLNSYGLLVHCSTIDTEDKEALLKIEEFKEDQTYYVRINTKFKAAEFDFSNLTETELINEWVKANEEYQKADKIIKIAKAKMMNCEELLNSKKVLFDGGSLTLCKNKVTYNVEEIFNKFGVEFFTKHTSIVLGKVDEFIEKGIIEYKEISNFKKIIDVNLKFVMIKLSQENEIINLLKEKNLKTSLNKAM